MNRNLCYRCRSDHYEQVWAYVQAHGGYMSIRCDCIDFWIASSYASFLLLIDSSLERMALLDEVY